MRKNVFLWIWMVVFIGACNRSPYPGFEKTKDGLYYKIIRGTSSKQLPVHGDYLYVTAKFYLHNKDSLLFRSENISDPVVLLVERSRFKGDLNEGLLMITEGDSACFIVKADSFYIHHLGYRELPDFIKPGDMLRFEIKVLKHKTREEFLQEQRMREQMRQQQLEELKKQELVELEKYIKENNITVKSTPSGLYFIKQRSGTGPKIQKGFLVKAHYTGYFLNGQVFDSSVGSNKPFAFVAGRGEVIAGWDEAVLMMRKGDKARIIVPSWLGYGESKPGFPIPPYATLIFDIEIIDVEATAVKTQ